MVTMLLSLMLVNPLKKEVAEPANYHIAVTVYRGLPGGFKDKGDMEVIASPRIVTRNEQQALISVGQMVPLITDVKKQIGKKITTVSDMQIGTILKILPKSQVDGSIFISGEYSISEAVSDSSILSRSISFHQMFQPGETRIVPLYNPNDYLEKVTVLSASTVRKKPYTGKEMWMEIKVVETPAGPGAVPFIPLEAVEKPNSP